MIQTLEQQLIRDEGRKSSVYKDSRGFWSIGIGICVDAAAGGQLFDEEIDFIFANRVRRAKLSLSSAFPWTDALDDVRREALLNLTFNLGVSGLSKFVKFLAAMQVGDWATADLELENSAAHQQEPERIDRVRAQIRSGVRQ